MATFKSASDCIITNIEIQYVNLRQKVENGAIMYNTGIVFNDAYLRKGQEITYPVESGLYDKVEFKCICNGNEFTHTKKFTPFEMKNWDNKELVIDSK